MSENATMKQAIIIDDEYTLIELVVVIAILGILAALAIPRLTGFQQNAKEKADVGSARTIAGAVSIAEAEGTISVAAAGKPTVAELVTAGYLAKAPESAQIGAGSGFVIAYHETNPWEILTIKVVKGTEEGAANGTVTKETVYPE